MADTAAKRIRRRGRHKRIRARLSGTSIKPRLCIFRSLNHIYAQLIDDSTGNTVMAISSLNTDAKSQTGTKTEMAKRIGDMLGKQALNMGIREIVFDRGGYKYHGRVKALADASREAGLKF